MRDEEFERLYAEHAAALLAFLVYRTGDRTLAEDLLSETFEKALRARHRYDPRRAARSTWLHAIALNALRDHARRRGAEQRALERASPRSEGRGRFDEEVAERDAVLRALEVLSPEEREVIALRFGAGLTVPEIARLLRQRKPGVEARTYRALHKLRRQLERP